MVPLSPTAQPVVGLQHCILTPFSVSVVGGIVVSGTHRRTLESAGSLVVTKTWNENAVTPGESVNCHGLGELVAPVSRTTPLLWRKNCSLLPKKSPVPSAFATSTVPKPPVTCGAVWKNTLTPPVSAVVPSAVFIGCAVRFFTVTSASHIPVPAS